MVLFEVKGWDLKNNNKIKVGGLPEKRIKTRIRIRTKENRNKLIMVQI